MNSSKVIRDMRLSKGLSQENMAASLNIDVSTYGRIERGATELKFETLLQILKIFDASVENLLFEVSN